MHNLMERHPELSDAIRQSFYDDFAEHLDEFGIFEPERITEVSSQAYDGFIPFTNGGLDAMVMQFLNYHYNAHGAEEKIIAPYVESSENDAAANFVDARDREVDSLGLELAEAFEAEGLPAYGGPGCADFVYNWFDQKESEHAEMQARYPDGDLFGYKLPAFWSTDAGILREEFQSFTDEWLSEGGEYWLCARVLFFDTDNRRNITGSPEAFFIAGVNTDFSYGRDKGLVSTFERTYKVERLTPKRVQVIVKAMRDSLSKTD